MYNLYGFEVASGGVQAQGRPQMKWPVAALLIVSCLPGCFPGDRPFQIRAMYRAPKSGYALDVVSKGVVKSSEDIANTATTVATIRPIGDGAQKPIALHIDDSQVITCQIEGLPSSRVGREVPLVAARTRFAAQARRVPESGSG